MMKYKLANRYKRLLTLAALLLLAPQLQAQNVDGLYVLTNGRVRWQTAHGAVEVPIGIAKGSWKDSIPENYTSHGAYTDTTLITEIPTGALYMALNIANHEDGTDNGIVAVNDFSPYCVWLRTGNSGYYYQEWGDYRYFLLANSTQGLYLKKVAVGTPIDETTQWYDWDFGAAIQESYLRNGRWKNSYYWIMYDATEGKWTLSCDSYERPETIIYRPNGGGNDSAYCYDANASLILPLKGGDPVTVKATGLGAMFSAVDSTESGKKIASITPANKGLTGIDLSREVTSGNPLKYQQSFTATAATDFEGGVTVNITPAFTKYSVAKTIEGMNLNYNNRSYAGWGAAGDTTYAYYYYYGGAIHDAAPDGTNESLTAGNISSYSYRLNNSARRYLTLTDADQATCTVTCSVLPMSDRVDTLFLTVNYTNGTSQTSRKLIYLTNDLTKVVKEPNYAPVIYGAVFGGGRQADVTGNTAITMHRCDTVSAVYGGNDISGSVGGTTGATITLGTANTDASHPVRVGSVYGGGNGFYDYQYVSGDNTALTEGVEMTATQFHGSVRPWGATDSTVIIVASAPNGSYIPTIKKTHITVATDNVVVDSLFGGAKNAYLTGQDGAVVQIDNVHGSVFAEFGGNNYGGNLGATTNTVTINVSGTRTYSTYANAWQSKATSGVENNYFHGFGRDFGIRYLYGGGNKVVAPTVAINVTGGMVDTLFAGGNSASVAATSCTVNATDSSFFTNTTAVSGAPNSWVGGRANYNVRCLFGGNNQAAMNILPTLTLTSGGIGTVYGGGNAGDMTAASTAHASELTAVFTTPSGTDSTGIAAPASLGTYIKVTSNNMKIDYLYGGCNLASVTNSSFVRLQGGQIGTVFGGCNISGDVGGTTGGTYVVLDGSGPTVWANVFAGANGDYHCNKNGAYVYGIQFADNAGHPFDPYDDYLGYLIPTHNKTNLLMSSGTVWGNVYGGACMADVGVMATKHGAVHMTMTGGTVKHNVFGGGNMAYVWGLGYLLVKGTTQIDGSLYAGNDKVGRVESYDSYTDGGSRTGLNFKASDGVTELNRSNNNSFSSLFSTYLLLQGSPTISSVYGSGNGAYNYSNPSAPDYVSICPSTSGDYTPIQSSTCIDINVSGGRIDTVFGGGNGVSVRDNLTLLFNAANTSDRYVNYIFGGNNKDNMVSCVPEILLTKGKVLDVYGGGNAGNMNGNKDSYRDICDQPVGNVSTYIKVTSATAIIEGSLYGGCNRADVKNMAYIDIRNTDATHGIANVYGGNNVGGKIYGNTRIDISGGKVGNIFGGSNGKYDYVEIGGDEYKAYPYQSASHVDAGVGANLIATVSRPDVDSTTVNIFGGTIGNVYGGGQLGNCRATYVNVNDQVCGRDGQATITGNLFGGGAGDYENLNNPRLGNVGFQTTASSKDTGSTHVHLHHAYELSRAAAYGGGRGGDVYNTYITAYSTWDKPFEYIYGGCWGSDVYGTANLTMNGTLAGTTANNVFGGNDFTGNVYKCNLRINGGTYGNIYGAGNGDYADADYTENNAQHNYSGANRLYVPNAEYVEVDFRAGTVDGNLYGGGKLGTTFSYLKDNTGHYARRDGNNLVQVDIARNATADTTTTLTTAYADPTKYSYVLVNVHGGRFNKNIYAGGAGADKQIVYGLKMLNIDGADTYVKESVYGGSENVNDGYGATAYSGSTYIKGECVNGHRNAGGALDSTTMRPSSIMNIAGGTIMNNVYGAGYMGDVYGSVYVNIGMDAIANSPVWTNTYKGQANAYALFKPGASGGYVPALTKSALALDASVYGGANWGTNTGSYNFNARGFYGGESRIFIDGNGYETDNDGGSPLPQMIIVKSVVGSGTSANGGDVRNRVDIQNYGALGSDCNATRQLKSIQRADTLWLWNTGIRYTGDNDAVSAYPSQQYTINRVHTVNARGYNLMEVDALMTNISTLNFYKDNMASATDYVVSGTLYGNSVASSCPTILCEKITAAIDPSTKKYTAVLVNNGVNIDIIGENGVYGEVNGFAYLLAEEGTNAIVAARSKTQYTGAATNPQGVALDKHANDGGFMSECQDHNKRPTFTGSDHGWGITWGNDGTNAPEYEYENYYGNYRVWSVGQGRRSRYAVILAHANPSKLLAFDMPMRLPDTASGVEHAGEWFGYDYALAHSVLDLPASAPGNYYKLSASGIVLRDDNSVMDLADYAWNPVDTNNMKYITQTGANKWWKVTEDVTYDTATYYTTAHWEKANGTVQTIADDIGNNPGSTFGLVMASGDNFQKVNGRYIDPEPSHGNWNNGATIITGNANVSISSDYRSAKVGGDVSNACPRMNLYLTYDTFFSTTLLGTVSFTLEEYNPTISTTDPIGSIDVVVTISTIIDKFIDQEYDVLAMDNEGRSNIFTRKAVLPATLEARDLYLEKVTWYPTDLAGTGTTFTPTSERFYLTDNETTVLNTSTPNTFALSITPTDNVSSSVTSATGWHDIETGAKNLSLYDLTSLPRGGRAKEINDAAGERPEWQDLTENGTTRGLKMGQLDGRGLAALNVDLIYDGLKKYPKINDKGYVGKAIMTFRSYKANVDQGSFNITINVKCRDHGDTIYLASADTMDIVYPAGDGYLAKEFHIGSWTRAKRPNAWKSPRENGIGKSPSRYVDNFTDAFNKSIYQEGDVIAIMGEVDITPGQQLTIQGADYAAVPIIRYTGHHHEWPGEKAVYRGTMINVIGGKVNNVEKTTSFSTRSIAFDGSSLGKLKSVTVEGGVWKIATNYYPDTNAVHGPIIAVANNGGHKTSVSLEHNTSVSNNWNINEVGGVGVTSAKRGAISVTDNARLELVNSVTIEHNLNVNQPKVNASRSDVPIPDDGAVYVDHGVVSMGESHKETAVTITDNYLYPKTVAYSSEPDTMKRFWTSVWKDKPEPALDSLMRYTFDVTKKAIDTATRANVFLTRKEATTGDYLNDLQSDTIVFSTSIAEGTKIGVTKWFPGLSVRDTISIVMQPNGNLGYINEVMTHGNFYSDIRPYDTLYNNGIDNKTIFLHRCATFKQQIAGEQISSLLPLASVPTGDALYYGYLQDATCPTGGDSITYRVQGGFFPYTYTWSSSTSGELQRVTTDDANNIVMIEAKAGNYTKAKAAISNTFLTPHVEMTHSATTKLVEMTVVATDAAGCRQKKVMKLHLNKTATGTPKFEKINTTSYWTARDTANDHYAEANRNFKAIQIYPRVWADRSSGVISAMIADATPGVSNDTIYLEDDENNRHDLDGLMFCEGDVIRLATAPKYGSGATQQRFIMWDFDPYYSTQVNYVVPSASDTVRAYYGPKTYWKDHINNVSVANAAYDNNYYYTSRNGKNYVTTYHGDVHIYDENGLAWFISVVNGLNGTQARSFFFNSVYLHDKGDDNGDGKPDAYDMKDYLWTPVGSMQHPFRGRFIGANKDNSDSCTRAGNSRVVIKNIIIDEPNVDYTGFFGFLDSATVENIELQGALVRGAQYVGGLAANTRQTQIKNCAVADSSNKNSSATILTTHYASGGMVGKANQSTITGSDISAKYVGDAVYSGGVVGYGTSTKVYNTGSRNISRMQSVYAGGVAGYLDGVPSDTPASKDANDNDGRSYVMNNYVYFTSQGSNQRAGGLVGYAKNTVIENNYVYGDIAGEATEGAVGAVLDEGSEASNNYYEQGSVTRSVGQHRSNASSSRNTDFSGEGNHVTLSSSNYGVNNLTRALNIWVRAKGDSEFNTWRSDLEHQNDGYPLFGSPDLIPVSDSLLVTGCDSVEWEGQVYLFDEEVISHVIDSVMMIDSTFTLHVLVNHATREQVTDSVNVGDAYEGYGFTLSDVEVLMIYRTVGRSHTTTIVLTDTLQTIHGCDSIVTLTLTINPRLGIVEPTTQSRIHVYPNPTTSRVTIEATEAMSQVELYDNQGRRVESFNAHNSNDITIDVSRYPSGAYYLRVHTDGNITIQKLIKK